MISAPQALFRLSKMGFGQVRRRGLFTTFIKDLFKFENKFYLSKLVIHETERNNVKLFPTYSFEEDRNIDFTELLKTNQVKTLFASDVEIIASDPHSDAIPNIVEPLRNKTSCNNLTITSSTQANALGFVEIFKPQKLVIKNLVEYVEDILDEECIRMIHKIDLKTEGDTTIDFTKRSPHLCYFSLRPSQCHEDQILDLIQEFMDKPMALDRFEVFYPVSETFTENFKSKIEMNITYASSDGWFRFRTTYDPQFNAEGMVQIEDDRIYFATQREDTFQTIQDGYHLHSYPFEYDNCNN